LKYHLAKITGKGAEIFPASIPEIVHLATQSIIDIGKKKDENESLRLKLAAGGVERSMRTTSFSWVGGNPRK